MTDKELLELAAKAAGIALYWAEDDPECDWVQGSYPRIPNNQVLEKWTWKIWNPLTDDGDALRLAVKRHLFDAGRFKSIRHEEMRKNPARDDCEITRRAIVLAAAETVGASIPVAIEKSL